MELENMHRWRRPEILLLVSALLFKLILNLLKLFGTNFAVWSGVNNHTILLWFKEYCILFVFFTVRRVCLCSIHMATWDNAFTEPLHSKKWGSFNIPFAPPCQVINLMPTLHVNHDVWSPAGHWTFTWCPPNNPNITIIKQKEPFPWTNWVGKWLKAD